MGLSSMVAATRSFAGHRAGLTSLKNSLNFRRRILTEIVQ
jgi:hypothetical protein